MNKDYDPNKGCDRCSCFYCCQRRPRAAALETFHIEYTTMKTVLFADDDRAFREICKRILEDEGYRVALARGGAEAIDAVKTNRPDVAILDIHMPLKGGLDAAEQIHAFDPSIPIILYTANDDTCTRDHRSCFAAACVEKSSDFTELALAVARLLHPVSHNGLSYRVGLNPLPQGQPPRQKTA